MSLRISKKNNNDWSNVRGKKIGKPKIVKEINTQLINKRVLLVVNSEISSLEQSFGYLPNMYAKWLVN